MLCSLNICLLFVACQVGASSMRNCCDMTKIMVTHIYYPVNPYSNIPHIRNSIFHLRPKNVSHIMRLSGNEGQCFLYEGCKLIAFHMSCLITQGK